MAVLSLVRTIVFSVTTFFSFLVLALSAAAIASTSTHLNGVDSFEGLAIATALLTLFTLPVFLLIGRMRDGAFTSKIILELSWISFLWVMWLATAADTASSTSIVFANGCNGYRIWLATLCGEILAFEAFAFLNWIILFVYSIAVLSFAINAHTRGEPMWTSSVKELTWAGNGTGVGRDIEKAPPSAAMSPSYPPTPQQTQSPAPTNHTTAPGYAGGFPQPQQAHPSSQYPTV